MLGQHTFAGSIAKPLATDASMDATKQTAAGVALPLLELFLFPFGDLEFLVLLGLPGLLDDFLPGLLDVFLPFFPLELDLAGVACLGFPAGPLCENCTCHPAHIFPFSRKCILSSYPYLWVIGFLMVIVHDLNPFWVWWKEFSWKEPHV